MLSIRKLIILFVAASVVFSTSPKIAFADEQDVQIGLGILGIIVSEVEKADRKKKERIAQQREQARIAELKKTKKGRAQLEAEIRQQQKQQQAMTDAIIGFGAAALFGDGGSSGGSGGYQCPENYYMSIHGHCKCGVPEVC